MNDPAVVILDFHIQPALGKIEVLLTQLISCSHLCWTWLWDFGFLYATTEPVRQTPSPPSWRRFRAQGRIPPRTVIDPDALLRPRQWARRSRVNINLLNSLVYKLGMAIAMITPVGFS
jgi:hypothetical protein